MCLRIILLLIACSLAEVLGNGSVSDAPAHLQVYPGIPSTYPFSVYPSVGQFRPTIQHRTYYVLPSPSPNSIRPHSGTNNTKLYEMPKPTNHPLREIRPKLTTTKTTKTTAKTAPKTTTISTTTTTSTTAAPDFSADEQDTLKFKETFKNARQLIASQLPDDAPNKETLAVESESLDQKLEVALSKYRFSIFDKDSDDAVTVREVGVVVEKLCGKPLVSTQEIKVKQKFAKYDKNGDGKLDFDEFAKMPIPISTLPTIREGLRDGTCNSQLRMLFTFVDVNENGFLSSAELRKLGKVFIQEDTDEISDLIDSTVGVLDKDDDGQFDFNEFEEALKTIQG